MIQFFLWFNDYNASLASYIAKFRKKKSKTWILRNKFMVFITKYGSAWKIQHQIHNSASNFSESKQIGNLEKFLEIQLIRNELPFQVEWKQIK